MRKNPLFITALAVCGVVALGEGYLIYERFMASREAEKVLAQRQGELLAMGTLNPPPKREVAAAIATDLTKAQAALAAMQGELKGRGPAAERLGAAKLPPNRTDAYFDLATFVEKTRELAKKNDITVRGDASRFGFAAFANQGPEAEHIEPVFRQRQIAQYLIEALIEARPQAILAVRREATLGKEEREKRAAAHAAAAAGTPAEPAPGADGTTTTAEGPDYFTIDPRVTARVPGFIDTVPFKLTFTGQTAALRLFLNKLASFELPVLVREVEVETASAEDTAAEEVAAAEPTAETSVAPSVVLTALPPAPKAAAKAAPKAAARTPAITPIVSKPLSKYTVTVEFVELVAPAAPADGSAPAPAPPS
ncbi:MAG: Amuc_1100 family pilus-like protein [Opitutaceae bacterium]|nr:Amuc_1100 family pilus-like protein [Opitutaceae bacterium]